MEMKVCTACERALEFSAFHRRARSFDGLTSQCRKCRCAAAAIRRRTPEGVAYSKAYHGEAEAKARAAALQRKNARKYVENKRRARERDPKRFERYAQSYAAAHPGARGESHRKWSVSSKGRAYYSRPEVKLRTRVRGRLKEYLQGFGARKLGPLEALLGYTMDDLARHLEALFLPGMMWANHGLVWHIDHRRPISAFRAEPDIRSAFALSNLQPLFAADNLKKGARLAS